MSLTSYRAAPPRGEREGAMGVMAFLCGVRKEGGLWSGLAVTYSPASWDAVPSAVARLTAEFGMGSGVSRSLWPPDRIRAPNIKFQALHTMGSCMLPRPGAGGLCPARHWIGSSLLDD